MDYFQFKITVGDAPQTDLLIALLSTQPFDTFEEYEGGFSAYLPAVEDVAAAETYLAELQSRFDFTWEKEFLPAQNWNEVWEANFQPVVVDDFCGIRAEFHEPLIGVEHELVIQPKMAFGTGHHETTFMCIQLMRDLPLAGTSVFDFGCGTGVLAILSSKLGAACLDALDIEKEAVENTLENCQRNGVENIHTWQGTLEDFLEKNMGNCRENGYDVVLANINRNVILASLPLLKALIRAGGWAIFSGFIAEDESLMRLSLQEGGFEVEKIQRKNNWLAMLARAQS